ncbi:hypothetical protein DDZ13_13030 [Coraliomargarita sinensis]|uniref:Uncharacterized protein n=1 Tax=Coraliomargarita sinensis TaxID=2174842 RepID=A0A317ZDY2_9BACT|nr:hypothetical protein DDZ13_13030 [Coraliomargarita sinensis]
MPGLNDLQKELKKTEKEKFRFTGIDYAILAAIILVLVAVGIRFYFVLSADWPSIFESMTIVDWIISALVLGLIEFIRRKLN